MIVLEKIQKTYSLKAMKNVSGRKWRIEDVSLGRGHQRQEWRCWVSTVLWWAGGSVRHMDRQRRSCLFQEMGPFIGLWEISFLSWLWCFGHCSHTSLLPGRTSAIRHHLQLTVPSTSSLWTSASAAHLCIVSEELLAACQWTITIVWAPVAF